MILNDEQVAAFRTAAQPLMDFLKSLGHPHCSVMVMDDNAIVYEGLASIVRPMSLPEPWVPDITDAGRNAFLPPGVKVQREAGPAVPVTEPPSVVDLSGGGRHG